MFIPQWQLSRTIEEKDPEHDLYDDLACEFTQIMGFEVDYYVKKASETIDYLYGEDPMASLDGPYRTKLVYQPTAEMNVLSAFGMTSDETIEFATIPKTFFSYTISADQPKPGDVIRTLWNNNLYEIVDVGAENKIFQGRKMVWELILRPWRQDNMQSDDFISGNLDNLSEFPDINALGDTFTNPLSAFGQNEKIRDESKDIHEYPADIDTETYGYGKL